MMASRTDTAIRIFDLMAFFEVASKALTRLCLHDPFEDAFALTTAMVMVGDRERRQGQNSWSRRSVSSHSKGP